jgi:hypothetical protein
VYVVNVFITLDCKAQYKYTILFSSLLLSINLLYLRGVFFHSHPCKSFRFPTKNPPLGLERPKKFEWMTDLHGILHGNERIMCHSLLDMALGPSKRDAPNRNLEAVAIN